MILDTEVRGVETYFLCLLMIILQNLSTIDVYYINIMRTIIIMRNCLIAFQRFVTIMFHKLDANYLMLWKCHLMKTYNEYAYIGNGASKMILEFPSPGFQHLCDTEGVRLLLGME